MRLTRLDSLLHAANVALRTLFAPPQASRSRPIHRAAESAGVLSLEDRQRSGALMRVNHVGEVCAQALYTAQALSTRNAELQIQLRQASQDEQDHLAWTLTRLHELGSRPSLLNPLWYAGAFGLGLLAGRLGDAVSMGFVMETERQVQEHLGRHLDRLPANDQISRAIVAQMQKDEAHHAREAQDAGALELPPPVKALMRSAAKVMTTTAHYI